MTEKWRAISDDDHVGFLTKTWNELRDRRMYGKAHYGPDFVGDPLTHLRAVLLDSLFYCWAAERKAKAEWEERADQAAAEHGRRLILNDILHEQMRQDAHWSIPRKASGLLLAMLAEEFGECVNVMIKEGGWPQLRAEFVQAAAVCATWIEWGDATHG